MTTRRGFFAALAGAPAIPALAAAIVPVETSPAPDSQPRQRSPLLLTGADIDRIILRSCRLIGVLASGQILSQSAMEDARYALGQLLDAWDAEGVPSNNRMICFRLAQELAYEYGVRELPRSYPPITCPVR